MPGWKNWEHLLKFEVGDRVIYTPKGERGEVTSINSHYVFVRYDGNKHQYGIATKPEDLRHE